MPSGTTKGKNTPNHLIREKSPYLKQHAHNPVDWYPWGNEAFLRAAEEHKPIFLSIGYATCHWCHVMAQESFEDPGIATLLNTHFIAIKVDREERPDIDSVYMAACQQMIGQGGWPLTIIMTPDKKPFFAGTYFPRTSRSGMMGLSELLEKVIRLWRDERGTIVTAAEQLTDVLLENHDTITEGTADTSLLMEGYNELALSFDRVHGGFGRAPKFPTPSTLLFLLRYGKRTGKPQALRMVEQTLDAIRCGGIHDHIGGGFHRYSTDARWQVPHFEKMLYDQAQLLMAFTEAWLITKKPVYRDTSEDIIRYVTGNLTSPEGAFFSAEDADSIDGEGAFYLWTKKEVEDILGPDDGLFTVDLFGISSKGNFISPDTGPGKNILFLTPGSLTTPEKLARFVSVREKLLAQRQERTRPLRDEKILTDWNGLMIAGLARAFRAFDSRDYLRAAETAMRFILKHLRTPDGGLLHRYCDGEADIVAFADDYAFTIRALLELYEASFDPVWLEEALALHGYLGNHFSDTKEAGFFSCSDEGDALIVRKKEIYDGAIPSGNSVILGNLLLMGHLTGDPKFEEEASRLSDHFAGIVRASPSGYTTYLSALDYLIGPASDIVIAGKGKDRCVQEMIRLIRNTYLPTMTVHFRADPGDSHRLDELAPFTRAMKAYEGNATAYLCTGHTCSMPITTVDALLEQLGEKKE